MTKKYYLLSLILLTGFLFCGCSRNVGVHGKVAYSDGKPLEKGIVCFQGENFVARGLIKSDGSFRMATEKPNDGIPPGQYKVFISGALKAEKLKGEKVDPDGSPSDGDVTPLINPTLMNPETSGIVCEVKRGMKLPFDIAVEEPSSKKK